MVAGRSKSAYSDRTDRGQGIGPETQRRGPTPGNSPNGGEVLPPARHVAPLRTPADCTTERKRLYRAYLNGKVSIEEAAKLSYMIGGIRADLETDAIIDQPGAVFQTEITITGVPCGGQVDEETGKIIYADGELATLPPYAGFVATPEFPEAEPSARIKQLEHRCELLGSEQLSRSAARSAPHAIDVSQRQADARDRQSRRGCCARRRWWLATGCLNS